MASGRNLFVQWLSAHPVPVKEQDRIADSWAMDVGERVSTRQRSSDHSCSGHRSGSLTDGCDEFPPNTEGDRETAGGVDRVERSDRGGRRNGTEPECRRGEECRDLQSST